MTTAGTLVKGGFYFNRDAWDLVAVNGKEGVLPGTEGQRCLRVPVWAMLGLAPVLGGLFVVFLPLIGFALVFMHLGRGALALGQRGVRGLLLLVAPSWRPGHAYFAGKGRKVPASPGETSGEGKQPQSPAQ
ncbi:MAG: hypothetical protein ABSB49_00690 [Polyangia bacterium]|jgi:hypothetical protein